VQHSSCVCCRVLERVGKRSFRLFGQRLASFRAQPSSVALRVLACRADKSSNQGETLIGSLLLLALWWSLWSLLLTLNQSWRAKCRIFRKPRTYWLSQPHKFRTLCASNSACRRRSAGPDLVGDIPAVARGNCCFEMRSQADMPRYQQLSSNGWATPGLPIEPSQGIDISKSSNHRSGRKRGRNVMRRAPSRWRYPRCDCGSKCCCVLDDAHGKMHNMPITCQSLR